MSGDGQVRVHRGVLLCDLCPWPVHLRFEVDPGDVGPDGRALNAGPGVDAIRLAVAVHYRQHEISGGPI